MRIPSTARPQGTGTRGAKGEIVGCKKPRSRAHAANTTENIEHALFHVTAVSEWLDADGDLQIQIRVTRIERIGRPAGLAEAIDLIVQFGSLCFSNEDRA